LIFYDDLINKFTRNIPPYVNLTIFVSSCYDGCLADTSNQLVSQSITNFTSSNWCGLTIITSTDNDSKVPCAIGIDSPTEDFLEASNKDLDGDGKVGDLRDRFMHMREESKTLYPESKFYRFPYGSEWGALD